MASSSSGSSNDDNSVSNFGVTFVLNFIILMAFIIGFLVLRPKQKRIYQPRSTIDTIPSSRRPRPLKSGIFGWFVDLVTRREAEVLQDAGLDGYFFLRYLRMIFIICIVGIIFVCPILLAVNATGGNGKQGFNMLSFQNVKDSKRYYAHALVSWFFFGFIMFTLYREIVYYIGVRQAVLTSPAFSGLVSSRTILIATIPDEFLNTEALTEIFDGVKYIWINRNLKELSKKVEERDKLAMKVEGAETKLIKTAITNRLKSEKKKSSGALIEGDNIANYVPEKKRPSHKLKPIIGKKVDTILYGREHMSELNQEISQMRDNVDSFPNMNSVFICFNTQAQAETAVQVLSHHQALHMAPRYIGIRPDEIIWSNMRLKWWERIFRSIAACAFIIVLIIFWTIPVAVVGSISNIDSLIEKLPWLGFLHKIPHFIYGVVSGFLPTVLLAVLMALLPIILRAMAKIAGAPTKTLVEYYVQNAYFGFQVVQVFLVTTIASGAASVVQEIINNPSSTMNLLADNLPKSSNFYISYFLLQGFTIAGGALLQLVTLILFHVLGSLLDSTPRKKWNRWNVIGMTGWGTVFPVYTNLAVIAISYAIISPLMLAFTAICFGCVYLAYLHNLLFVVSPSEGRGIFYPRAIYQTFTGLYLAEICLLGLFVVAKAWGPLVLEVIMIIITVFVQLGLQSAFAPLIANLPRDLLAKTAAKGNNRNSAGIYGGGDEPVLNHTNPSYGTSYNQQQPTGVLDHPHDNTTRSPYTNGYNNGYNNQQPQPVILEKPNHLAEESISSSGGGAVPVTSQSKLESGDRGISPRQNMSMAVRYFKPHIYLEPSVVQSEFLTHRFREAPMALTREEESGAYANPAITAINPVVWIPRDPWGLSQTEVRELRGHEVNAYDEGAWFDINAKKKVSMEWGQLDSIPIWKTPGAY